MLSNRVLVLMTLAAGGFAGTAGAAPQPAITGNVNVQAPLGGGLVVTPSAGVTVPVGGATVQAGVQAPIVVPPNGPPVVTSPSVNVGVTVPLK